MRHRESIEVFEEYFRECLHPSTDLSRSFDPEFEQIARDCLARGARHVFDLPDDDPFWAEGRHLNPQTTQHKVWDYFKSALQADPGNDEARWFLVSWDWRSVSFVPAKVPLFLPWIQRDRTNLRWLINATRRIWHGSGQLTTPILREVLEETARHMPDLRVSLEELSSDADTAVQKAADAALLVLSGRNLPEEEQGGGRTLGTKD